MVDFPSFRGVSANVFKEVGLMKYLRRIDCLLNDLGYH